MSTPHQTVRVDLGARSYDILIGEQLLEKSGVLIAEHTQSKKVGIITDRTVTEHYLKPLEQSLEAAGINYITEIIEPGETSKSFENYTALTERFLDAGMERGDALIALGGGVVGDLTGFVASTLKRGCKFVQIPTTLLAQVDSSVGGKTAINSAHGKNLIGSFYQPQLVLADISTLKTLPDRQVMAGYAEIIKYGWLGDEAFTAWLEQYGKDVLALKPDAISRAVAKSCEAKARIVAEDERETGRRALLNLGHTFAHALEARAGYSGALLHGEAVAIGMLMATDYSVRKGLCPQSDFDRCLAHAEHVCMPKFSDLPPVITEDPQALLAPMRQDKKNVDGQLTLILTRGIGQAFVSRGESEAELLEFLTDYCKAASAQAKTK